MQGSRAAERAVICKLMLVWPVRKAVDANSKRKTKRAAVDAFGRVSISRAGSHPSRARTGAMTRGLCQFKPAV